MSWNNVKQLPCSQCLCCRLHLSGFPMHLWNAAMAVATVVWPRPTAVPVQRQRWYRRNGRPAMTPFHQLPTHSVCADLMLEGNGDDAAEFCWRGAFPVSTEALRAEKCPLVNNTQRIFSANAHILKNEILKGWNDRSNPQGISICRHGADKSLFCVILMTATHNCTPPSLTRYTDKPWEFPF